MNSSHGTLDAMITLKRVTQVYDGKTVLSDVSLRIDPKETVCIVGESGSGKTALFSILSTEETPSSGTVTVDGADLGNLPLPVLQLLRTRIGLLFPVPRFVSHLTVAENVALPLELRKIAPKEIKRRVATILTQLHIKDVAGLFPGTLPAGTQAMVGVARAFVGGPMIILADEPLQLLDSAQADLVLALFAEAREHGRTIIVFTSDPGLASRIGGRTIALSKGTVEQSAHTKEDTKPHSRAQHHVLDAEEKPVSHQPTEELPATSSPSKKDDSDGKKKIRITSIGS